MTRVLQLMALIAALVLPALCQYGRLSPDDQREFDKAYTKWVNDSRKNDRDDIDKDVRKMQDIMARNNIAPSVPYDQIATSGYNNDYRGYAQSRLSSDDQHEFDKVYEKWEKHIRKNDRDDIRKDERKMQDIMARYNIPRNVPYDQVASPEYRH